MFFQVTDERFGQCTAPCDLWVALALPFPLPRTFARPATGSKIQRPRLVTGVEPFCRRLSSEESILSSNFEWSTVSILFLHVTRGPKPFVWPLKIRNVRLVSYFAAEQVPSTSCCRLVNCRSPWCFRGTHWTLRAWSWQTVPRRTSESLTLTPSTTWRVLCHLSAELIQVSWVWSCP